MGKSIFFSVLFFSAFLANTGAWANSWWVEQDGSGDFLEIQPAVDAAAAGDTIMIGPGRFDTFHPFNAPAWTQDVIVGVTKDNLTFIGSGKDITIIGTSLPYGGITDDPKSFCSIGSFDCVIRDLTIENVNTGIYWWEGNLIIQGCVIRGNSNTYIGIGFWFDSLSVNDCDFEFSGDCLGITTHPPSRNVSIRNCNFSGYGTGIGASGTNGITLENCIFNNLAVGAFFYSGTTGSLSNCQFFDSSVIGFQMSDNSVAEIHDVLISGSKEGMRISSGSDLTGSRVVIENSTGLSILLMSQARVSITESHIFPSVLGKAVWSQTYPYEHVILDFRGNFWGTTDPASIAAMIQDSSDNPDIHTTVLYEPYADGIVPTEEKSFGSIKAMFR